MRSARLFIAPVVCTAFAALVPQAARGPPNAQISGRVTDASGAIGPGVDVTLINIETGVGRSAVTNEPGAYAFPNLNPGRYRLQAALQGFRTFAQTDIVLQVGANVVIDPTLEAGQLAETEEVRGGATPLQVDLRAMAVWEVDAGACI